MNLKDPPVLMEEVTNMKPWYIEGRPQNSLVVLRELMDKGPRTVNELFMALYNHDPEGGPLTYKRNIHTAIHNAKQCLLPGWSIENRCHWKYELVKENERLPE